jgi:hypothetical protein
MNRRYPLICLAFIGIVASILACNAPEPATPVQAPTITPHVPATIPPQETAPPSPTRSPTETLLPTPTQWFPPTNTPAPEGTPTTSASTGPLDFPVPTRLDHWQPLSDGGHECKIVLHITGGVPPYTVHHDLDVFTTGETNPAITFTAHGCSALVHTIIVEAADGQSIKHDYWIPAPWCQ